MKKITASLIAIFLVFALSAMASGASVETPQAKMSDKAEVVIKGKGFKSGQEINIVLITTDGVRTDIGYALKPAPKADDSGSWSTTWSAGRFVSKKLVKKGSNKILIFDEDYNQLAQGTVVFSD